MIREYKPEDLDEVIEVLKSGFLFDEEDVRKDLDEEKKRFLVYDDKGIKGFMYADMPNQETKECYLRVYVCPNHRRQGIGTALYNEMYEYLKELRPNMLITRARVDFNDPVNYFKKLGFKKWYGLHDMVYRGGSQPEPDLKFVQYEDSYFEEYAKGVCDSFFEMRRENDIKPYVCFPASRENREETLKNKDCNYVLFENGKLIAAAIVKGGYIDDLFVIPEYQGMGLGKKVTQFAINKALENKAEKIELGVVEWNTRAIKNYESLGFEIVQTVCSYRQFFDK